MGVLSLNDVILKCGVTRLHHLVATISAALLLSLNKDLLATSCELPVTKVNVEVGRKSQMARKQTGQHVSGCYLTDGVLKHV